MLAAIATLLAAAPGRAVPAVTQVIDGLPQVIAPQQLIFSCSAGPVPLLGGLPLLCSTALATAGATVTAVGQDVFRLATVPASVSLQTALDTLRASSAIASAEPNRIFLGSATYPQTWNFPAAGAPGDSSLLPGRTSPLVAPPSPLVAVIDSGVAYENTSSLFGPGYTQAPVFAATPFAPGWDFVNNGPHADDDNGHGTAMATIIAGQGTFSSAAIPYVGPAAGATLMPIKVLDQSNTGTEFWLEEGIRYAVKAGAQVINLSLDFARNYTPGAALRDAIAKARASNVVVVGASGNTGGRVLYPAAFPDVISVGAIRLLDAADGYAVTSYSNRGEALDLVAPGGAPNQDVNLDGLWDGVLAQAFPPGSPNQISWWLFAGTSPAAAHVSAAAAALIGRGVAPASVRPLLLSTAAAMDTSAPWSARSGAGRLQAGRAVGKSSSYVAPAPLFADAVAALRADGRASGAVMIADAGGNGLANVEVRARWRGAAPASQKAFTDASGIARFVSPRPGSQRKLFLLEVPRVIYQGVPQRPRTLARSTSGFVTLVLNANLWDTSGLGLWGYGASSQGGGLGSGTTGSGLGSGTTGSGDGSGNNTCEGTGDTGNGDNQDNSGATYPQTTGINACLLPFPLFSYDGGSLAASSAFFSGATLASGYSVRSVDSSWVLAPGAAAIDQGELSYICGGLAVFSSQPLSSSYFGTGALFVAGSGSPPSGMGAGDSARFWAEVMNAEGGTAP
jgi:serine protease